MISEHVDGPTLARWLGVSGKAVYDLGRAGVLVRVGGMYRLEESVRGYCEHLRQAAEPRSHQRATLPASWWRRLKPRAAFPHFWKV